MGVIAALGRPWYAAAPPPSPRADAVGELHGPVDGLTDGIARWFSETGGATGWDSLGVVGHGARRARRGDGGRRARLPGAADPGRGARGAALRRARVFGVVLWKLIDSPGPNAALEPRYGAFVAAAAALIALTSGAARRRALRTRSRTARHRRTRAGRAVAVRGGRLRAAARPARARNSGVGERDR